MKILAIDHGASTGFALLVDGIPTCYGLKKITGDTDGEKLYRFTLEASHLIETFKPDIVVVEIPHHTRNAKVERLLTGYFSIILSIAYFHKAEIIEVHPTTMKKTITGYGGADKHTVAMAIANLYSLDLDELLHYEKYKKGSQKGKIIPKSAKYDITDALALATYAYRRVNNV